MMTDTRVSLTVYPFYTEPHLSWTLSLCKLVYSQNLTTFPITFAMEINEMKK